MSENILSSLNIAILSVDHELKLCFINQSAEILLDISATRALGSSILDIMLDANELQAVLYESLQTDQPFTQRRAQLRLHDGHLITVDYAVTPINEGEWPRLLIELYPLDRYLRIDRDEALRGHQEATRQMIRGLAHEIKNPLGGIRGSAQLLARELSDPDQKEFTDIIISETDRLTSLVDRLLGPKTVPKPEMANIHEVLERVRKLITLETNLSLEIKRDYDPSIPELLLDPELMVQVFLNIARNALQALSDVPQPTLEFITRTERQYTIGARLYRNVLRVVIADNGPGIPEEIREQLFFPMISGRADGTGLGLSFAQSIVNQHKGLIEFESEPGNTKFSIILPMETA
ncbi:MAG: PAS domain S-box protein [Pseudomonadales bacterium]|nr:PAS domain S-box protein [Pseudomonadales bacterium]